MLLLPTPLQTIRNQGSIPNPWCASLRGAGAPRRARAVLTENP
jgi:hypothetical protein